MIAAMAGITMAMTISPRSNRLRIIMPPQRNVASWANAELSEGTKPITELSPTKGVGTKAPLILFELCTHSFLRPHSFRCPHSFRPRSLPGRKPILIEHKPQVLEHLLPRQSEFLEIEVLVLA